MQYYLSFIIMNVFLLTSTFPQEQSISVNQNSYRESNPNYPNIIFGFQGGAHSSNLNQNSLLFERNLSLEVYFKYCFSDEINSTIGFSYWNSHTKEVKTHDIFIPAESINSKGLKIGLNFSLFKIDDFFLSMGPLMSIEDISKSSGATLSIGGQIKLNQGIWDNKIYLVSTVSYQNGNGIFELAGGGLDYSFFNYMIGIEINP